MARRRLVILVALAVTAAVGLAVWGAPRWLSLLAPEARGSGTPTGGELQGRTEKEAEAAPLLLGAGRPKEGASAVPPASAPTPLAPIVGTVVDEEGHGIAGAAIYEAVKEAREPLARSAADGAFTLAGEIARVPAGDVAVAYLWARAPGYVGKDQTTDAVTGTPCRITLVKGVSLRVRVLERATKTPIADARVRAIRGEDIGNASTWRRMVLAIDEARSDAQGRAVVGVPEGTAYARVTARGFAPDDSVVVMVGPEGADTEVLLSKGGSVRGVVRGVGGVPVAGAIVFFVVGPLVKEKAVTGADGRFAFEDVPAADSRDSWEPEGAPLEGGLLVRAAGHGRVLQSVELPAAGETRELVVTLGTRRVLEGSVLEADDQPVVEARVFAQCGDPAEVAESDERIQDNTDATGHFRLDDVPAGPVELLAYLPRRSATSRLWLVVPPEGDVPPVVLRAQPAPGGRTLEARVLDAEGNPIEQARVVVSGRASEYTQRGRSGEGGWVRIEGLPAEPVTVRVEAPGFGVLGASVDLTRGDVRDLRLIYPAGTSTVRVHRLDGSPARIEVYWMRWDANDDVNWGDFLQLDEHGAGTLRGMEDGEYSLSVNSTGVVLVAGPHRFRPGASGITWIAATEAEARGMRTSLALVDAGTKQPIEARSVRVVGALEEECAEDDSPGRYLAPPVLPGAFTLHVSVQGHLPSIVEGVQLGRAGAVVTVPVPLDLGATLAGRVVDEAGQPVGGVWLIVPSGEFQSAPDGTYRVTGLPRGPLTLEALGIHAVRTKIDVRIAAPREDRDLVVQVAGAVRVETSRRPVPARHSCRLRVLAPDGTLVLQEWQRVTGDDGSALADLGVLGGLRAGRYDLVVEVDGRTLPPRPIEIKAREETVVVVDPP